MTVTILSKPQNGAELAGYAAAVSTGSNNPRRSLKGSMASGHESVLEHASYTFVITGVSRVLLAQLTRHRIASFTVQSQRYCPLNGDNDPIMPESIQRKPSAREAYLQVVNGAMTAYRDLLQMGIPEEDARYCVPQAVTTTVVMTMNARELRHFFSLRCCNRAQWEIRELADLMLAKVKAEDPELFRDAGPGCVRGRCPEGSRSCGHPRGGINEDYC